MEQKGDKHNNTQLPTTSVYQKNPFMHHITAHKI